MATTVNGVRLSTPQLRSLQKQVLNGSTSYRAVERDVLNIENHGGKTIKRVFERELASS